MNTNVLWDNYKWEIYLVRYLKIAGCINVNCR